MSNEQQQAKQKERHDPFCTCDECEAAFELSWQTPTAQQLQRQFAGLVTLLGGNLGGRRTENSEK